jgi:predicted ATPase/DNA-binding winged helix-turn-helix (wHTH) protein
MDLSGRGRDVYVFEELEIDLARRELRSRGVPIPTGDRVFGILEALVEAAGETVTRARLKERGWPGLSVEPNTLDVHLSGLRRALGSRRALLQTVSGQGYRLLGRWRLQAAGLAASAGSAAAASPSTNLARRGDGLVGRLEAVRQVRELASTCRIVTLTGPGGIGKTSLTVEAVRGLAAAAQRDCWFVELASLSDPGLVPSSAARAMGLKDPGEGGHSAVSVARAIGPRRALLVLDNCEHVVDAAARLAEAVAGLCPHAAVLATSREVLRIAGEHVFHVPPLRVPAEATTAADALIRYGAVELFLARLAGRRPGILPGASELAAIAAICRRLDGIPLAIELAAAQAAELGPHAVLTQLPDRLGLTAGGRRTRPRRHQTLRATLDWSHDLLPDAERRLFRTLGVFRGGFTLEAAAAVAGEARAAAVAETLASLVERSLVILEDAGAAPRWRLLETTRAYALETLAASGDAAAVKQRHAAFFRAFLSPTASGQQGLTRNQRMALYGRELDNVRAALDWASSPGGDREAAVAITAAYVPVWIYLSLTTECDKRVSQALDGGGPGSVPEARLRMQLLIALGVVLVYAAERPERIEAALAQALELARGLEDAQGELLCLWALWNSYSHSGRQRAARSSAERFAQLAHRRGSPADIGVGERLLGTTLHYTGGQDEARRRLERVLRHHVAPAEEQYPRWFYQVQHLSCRVILARVLWLQGFPDRASAMAEASLNEADASGQELLVQFSLAIAVCPIAVATGDLARAERALTLLVEPGVGEGLLFSRLLGLCLKGQLLVRRGDYAAGSDVLRAALEARRKAGWTACHPEFLGTLAEGLLGLGRLREAGTVIEQALRWSERSGEFWYAAELHRMKGELALLGVERLRTRRAERAFAKARDLARRQGALAWELRASLSLARLRVLQGRQRDVRRFLAPVCSRYAARTGLTELRAARAMLKAQPKRSMALPRSMHARMVRRRQARPAQPRESGEVEAPQRAGPPLA